MEFYFIFDRSDELHGQSFNSQRDGILLRENLKSNSAIKCFNSQRDGILLDKFITDNVEKIRFQFPTGWNSTRNEGQNIRRFIGFQFPTGWNSTQIGFIRFFTATIVSIPNGMEFYKIFPSKGKSKVKFQFPTGWNSTKLQRSFLQTFGLFQFPTGWNSTMTENTPLALTYEFQFPTGWNSTNTFNVYIYTRKLFQFPTGWNST